MRRPSAVILSAVLSITLATLTACAVRGQQATRIAPSPLDSISARLVELELQRLASTTDPASQVGSPRDVNSQIAALHERLRALPNGTTADQEATNRVVLALDERASSVQAHLRQLRLYYTDAHPVVRQTLAEERAIDQRLSEIRSTR